MQYLRILWRRKPLVLAIAVIPAVVAVLIISASPPRYVATVVYEHPLTESDYSALLRHFFSVENLEKVAGRLEAEGATRYAATLRADNAPQVAAQLVQFGVFPSFPRRVQGIDIEISERISAFETELLEVEILADSRADVPVLVSAVTENLRDVMPLYGVLSDLKDRAEEARTLAAEIEDDWFGMQVDLEKEKARLDKLRALEPTEPESAEAPNVVLQFTKVDKSREFLPLSFQIRASQSRIIDREETLNSEQSTYEYHLDVLNLAEELLTEAEQVIDSQYVVEQYLAFLDERLTASDGTALSDYLKSHIRQVENGLWASRRADLSPMVYPVGRSMARHVAEVFVVSLMIAAFAAVALEYRDERRRQPLTEVGAATTRG